MLNCGIFVWGVGGGERGCVLKFVEDLQINSEVEESGCCVLVTDTTMNLTFDLDV
jgi:hypothetical protein